jgi:crossover junction endodeoxyribonuclease RuvC
MSRILGIDPGSRTTGYGIIDHEGRSLRYVTCGVVRAGNGDFPERLRRIYEAILELSEEFRPDIAAVEQVFIQRNPDSALKLGQARGAAICGCVARDVRIAEYTPRAIKQAVVGSGGAEKSQVQYMMRILLKLPAIPGEDAADALAVAVCHAHHVGQSVPDPAGISDDRQITR